MTAEFADQRLQVVRPQSPDVRDRTLIMMQPVQRLWQGTIHNILIYEKYECAEYFFTRLPHLLPVVQPKFDHFARMKLC